VLKERGSEAWNHERLEEAREVSALFYLLSLSLPLMQSKLGPSWPRFHHLLVALLRRHASTLASPSWETSQATPFSSEELPDKDTSSVLRDICRNLIAYCRVLTEQSIAGPLSPASSFTLVFAPSFRTSASDSAMITDEGIAHTTPPTSPPFVPSFQFQIPQTTNDPTHVRQFLLAFLGLMCWPTFSRAVYRCMMSVSNFSSQPVCATPT